MRECSRHYNKSKKVIKIIINQNNQPMCTWYGHSVVKLAESAERIM